MGAEMTSPYRVRAAEPADIPTVLAFIGKKADFDREVGAFAGEVRTTEPALATALFGAPPLARALLLEQGAAAVGFAFFYFRFSSFAGRPSVWLDDLFVDPPHRRGGAGRAIMARLAAIAADAACTHLAWTADERNVAGMSFYRKLGAAIVDQKGPSVTWRIEPAALAAATRA
jgi:GNAT superfamily N-acetyltransferase